MISSIYSRGFSLIELLVSIAIVTTIMTVVLSNQSNYTSGTALRNDANGLSLSLRQAQIYGISVKEVSADSQNFNDGYGVDFNMSDTLAYTFFDDKKPYSINPPNGQYDTGELLDKATLSNGDKLSQLCVIKSDRSQVCSSSGSLDITFVRPAIEAHIYSSFYSGSIIGAKIILISPAGATNSVWIYTTGQISVQIP